MISRRSHYGIVDFNEDDNEHKKESYCKHCIQFGFKVPLKNRIYPDNEHIPVDHDQWRQCHNCGSVVPVYEIEKEATIKDVIETTDNPFGIGRSFLGIDSRTSIGGKNARKKRERKKELDEIKETDLKAELVKGHTLLSYSEYHPQ